MHAAPHVEAAAAFQAAFKSVMLVTGVFTGKVTCAMATFESHSMWSPSKKTAYAGHHLGHRRRWRRSSAIRRRCGPAEYETRWVMAPLCRRHIVEGSEDCSGSAAASQYSQRHSLPGFWSSEADTLALYVL